MNRQGIGFRVQGIGRQVGARAGRLWARWNRFVDADGEWTDRMADGFGDWAARGVDRLWFGSQAHCDGCGRRGGMLYAMPAAIQADGLPSFVLRCDPCRAMWHQAIRDYYAHRAAEQAAARYDRERKEAA